MRASFAPRRSASSRCNAPCVRRRPAVRPRRAAARRRPRPDVRAATQADQRLRVGRGGDRTVEVVERPARRPRCARASSGCGGDLAQPGRVEEVHDLVHDPDARDVVEDRLPVRGGLADLLGELAPRGIQRRLTGNVELAGGDLEHVGVRDRLARLAHEPDVQVVMRDDSHSPGVMDDLALDLLAVGVAVAVARHVHDVPLPDGLAREELEPPVLGVGHASSSIVVASTVPAASAAAKNSGSSSSARPIVRAGSPRGARSAPGRRVPRARRGPLDRGGSRRPRPAGPRATTGASSSSSTMRV